LIPPDRQPEIVVVDIWKGYISAILEVCPEAVIVADKFACGLLRCWSRMAYDSNLPGFRDVARSYERWFGIITNYFKERIKNGFDLWDESR